MVNEQAVAFKTATEGWFQNDPVHVSCMSPGLSDASISVSVFFSQLCVTKWRHQTHGSRAFACHESHAGFYQILLLVFRVLKILQTCGGLNFSTINHKRINKERDRRTDKCLDIHPNISIPAENASIHRCTVYYTSDITQILWLQICDDTHPPLW